MFLFLLSTFIDIITRKFQAISTISNPNIFLALMLKLIIKFHCSIKRNTAEIYISLLKLCDPITNWAYEHLLNLFNVNICSLGEHCELILQWSLWAQNDRIPLIRNFINLHLTTSQNVAMLVAASNNGTKFMGIRVGNISNIF